MKIAIISDMHIGYERFELDALAQAKDALSLAAQKADAIIIPGDVFDNRNPKPDVIASAINIFRDLSKSAWRARVSSFISSRNEASYTDVPILAIPGTHERVAEGKANALSLLGLAGLLVDVSEATAILEKDGEKVAVFGFGGLSEERVKQRLQELKPSPVPSAFNIFMLHQSIYELLPFDNSFIRLEDLPEGFDLYVDGHIHSRFESKVHGKPFLISGSTVITQLKENEQSKKGFFIYDTLSKTYDFIEIKSRDFIFRKMSFSEARPDEIVQRCDEEIGRIVSNNGSKPIIRLQLEGTVEKGRSSSGLGLSSIAQKYSKSAVVEIDTSKIAPAGLEQELESIRSNKIEQIPIKEFGMSTLRDKMASLGIKGLDVSALFELLDDPSASAKSKTAAKVLDFLEHYTPG